MFMLSFYLCIVVARQEGTFIIFVYLIVFMTEESKNEEEEFVNEEIKDEVHELQDAQQEEQEEEET